MSDVNGCRVALVVIGQAAKLLLCDRQEPQRALLELMTSPLILLSITVCQRDFSPNFASKYSRFPSLCYYFPAARERKSTDI